jgi:hypothetical protein
MEFYKLSITNGELSVVIESHNKEWVEQKEKTYVEQFKISNERHIARKTQTPDVVPVVSEPKPRISESMPPNEFYRKIIHEKGIESRPDIVTFFVYYLVKVRKAESVNSSAIRDLFKESQYPKWNTINVSDALQKAKKKAFLNNYNDQWSLTITGEDFVLNSIAAEDA